MTTREKYLIIAGTVLGLLLASVLFGASHLIHNPEGARTQDAEQRVIISY